MPRPPLPIGTWGRIRRTEKGPHKWVATAQFRDSDGVTRPVTASGRTGAEAERLLRVKLTQRAAPEGDLLGPDTRIKKLAAVWLEEMRAEELVNGTTLDGYVGVLDRHVLPKLGNLTLREATVGRIDRHLKTLKAAGYTSVPKHTKVVLSHMFGLAVRHGAMDANPCASVAKGKRKRKEHNVRVVGLDDLKAVRDAVRVWMTRKRPGPKDNDLADIVDTLLGTGARIGEVLAIRWDDCDFAADSPTVTIAGTLVTTKQEGLYRQGWGKSHSSFRTLVLPPFLVDTLMRRMLNSPALNPYGAVFVTRKGTWKQPNNVRRQWRAARKGTGLEWVVPHTFRKTVATLIDDAVGGDAAQKTLGHSDKSVTDEYYVAKPALAPDVSAVLELFAPPSDW
jgi:integrase